MIDFRRRRFHVGLRGKLIFFILVIGPIPIVVGLSLVYIKEHQQLQSVIGASFEALAKDGTLKLDGEVAREIAINRQIAQQIVTDPLAKKKLTKGEHLRVSLTKGEARNVWIPIGANHPALTNFWITGPIDGPSVSGGQSSIATPTTARTAMSGLRFDNNKNLYGFQISTPIEDPVRKKLIGWTHRAYDAKKYFDPLIFPVRFGDTGHVMIIDNFGTVISCPFLSTGSRIRDLTLVKMVTTPSSGWVRTKGDGHGGRDTSLIGHAPLAGINRNLPDGVSWHAFAWQDSHEVFASVKTLQIGIALAGMLALGLLVVFGYYASIRIVRPIQKLREEAAHIASGDLNWTLDIRTHDEIEELADQFNEMRIQLRHLITTLEDKVRERTKSLEDAQAEKDRIVERLMKTEKLAAMGTMASGIAHEINNPLYTVMGMAEAILDEKDATKCREYLRLIIKNSRHIADIVSNLSGYVRASTDQHLESVDVNAVLHDAVTMARRSLLCDDVEFIESLRPVSQVSAKKEEMQQVFFNVIRNAIQAMKSKGTLRLESYEQGDQVGVTIRDTGCGIPPEVIGKIYDPFYTTKGPDEGTGLGLYIVHQIVSKYGGTISVDSQVDRGAVFTIQFPVGEKTNNQRRPIDDDHKPDDGKNPGD